MKTIDEAFGPLRGILDEGPSEASWDALGALMLEWASHEAFGEKLLPYVSEALTPWPDVLRVATSDWFLAPTTSVLSLARRLDVWLASPDTNPHSGAPMLQVLRLLPDPFVATRRHPDQRARPEHVVVAHA